MVDIEDKHTLDLLERRTAKLEEKIIGSSPKIDDYPKVIPTLSSLGSQLGNALSTRDRMMMVMKRLGELERYLDPTYGDSWEVSDTMKMDLVLSQEEQLRNYHHNLNILHVKTKVLDSECIADAATLNDELIELSHNQDSIEELTKSQAMQITSLFDKYNSIICTLTETLVKMDDVVSKAELAAKPKITDD